MDVPPLPSNNSINGAEDEDQGNSSESENEHEASTTTLELARSDTDADTATQIPIEDQLTQPIPENDKQDEEKVVHPPEFLFLENEKVLCFHGPLIYEAKIIKTQRRDNAAFYLVHYLGWNKKWNEWMIDDRILKYTDENLERQKDLKLAQEVSLKSAKKGNSKAASSLNKQQKLECGSSNDKTNSRSSTPIFDSKGDKIPGTSQRKELKLAAKRRFTSKNVESEIFFNKKQEVNIPIPDELKLLLAEDWERINILNQLVTLPSNPNLNQIVSAYLETRDENDEDAAEVLESLTDYFDNMLASQLLYPSEKLQMQDVLKREENTCKYFSDIYGGQHLLRLISKLGQFLAYSVIEKDQVKEVIKQLNEFFGFLIMKEEDYFGVDHYYTPSPEYIKKCRKAR